MRKAVYNAAKCVRATREKTFCRGWLVDARGLCCSFDNKTYSKILCRFFCTSLLLHIRAFWHVCIARSASHYPAYIFTSSGNINKRYFIQSLDISTSFYIFTLCGNIKKHEVLFHLMFG